MQFPATPGWGPPAVVVCGPLHSWLRVLVAAPRHSWFGSAVCGGVFRGWGIPCFVCLWSVLLRVWPCSGVFCVFVVSLLLVVWCGGVALVCLPRALVCVVACAWCAGGLWLVVPASLGWGSRLVFVWVWLACAVGPLPLLTEGPGCSAPPLLAGVCRCAVLVGPLPPLAEGFGCGARPLLTGVRRRVWWVVPHHSWPRAAPLPATPGWGPPVVVVGAPSPLWAPACPSPWPWCVCVCCVAPHVGGAPGKLPWDREGDDRHPHNDTKNTACGKAGSGDPCQ